MTALNGSLTNACQCFGMPHFTYILASRSGKAIYIGATNDLRKRVTQHCSGQGSAHTAKYNIHRLVYFEEHETAEVAYQREHKLKRWKRAWKDQLIQERNPNWSDLVMEIPL